MIHPADFFDLNDDIVASLFIDCEFVWEPLAKIASHIDRLVRNRQTILGNVEPGAHISNKPIYIGEDARIESGAYIEGPAYIGAGATVRHGAYIRDNVIMLTGSILGHASEAKNSIFLPHALAPHFNYVGDSILGYSVNLGAGTKLSNVTTTSVKDPKTHKRPNILISINGHVYDTNLSKLGAIIGDDGQTGCNSVTNPGCLIGKRTIVYANLSLRKGYYPPNQILKLRQDIEHADRR